MSPLRYVVYARKSQESDERQVQSLEDQVRLAAELGVRDRLFVAETIQEAMSAKEPGVRHEFDRMVSLIERGKVQGILAWHPDRLARNETDAATICRLLRKGILEDLRFVNYHFDNSPEGLMMLQMALSQSQYFSSKLSRDVLRGLHSKIDKGWAPRPAPQGYVNNLAEHTIDVDPERFALLRKAWEHFLTGAFTVPQVLDMLNNEWGYRTRKTKHTGGRPLSRTSAFNLFRNPFYSGQFSHKGTLHPGSHKPMVSLAEFDRVQDILASRSSQHPVLREFAYTGLMRCGKCGCRITADVHKGHTYYHCTNARGVCDKRGVREENVEEQIARILASVRLHPDFESWCREAAREWFARERSRIQQGQEQQEKAIRDTESQRSELLSLRLRKLITDDTYAAEAHSLEETLDGLRNEQQRSHESFDKAVRSAENALHFAAYAPDAFAAGGLRTKRAIAQQLGGGFLLTGRQVVAELHPMLESVVAMKKESGKMPPVGEGCRTPGIGSENKKDGSFEPSVPLGWEPRTLDGLCRTALGAPLFAGSVHF